MFERYDGLQHGWKWYNIVLLHEKSTFLHQLLLKNSFIMRIMFVSMFVTEGAYYRSAQRYRDEGIKADSIWVRNDTMMNVVRLITKVSRIGCIAVEKLQKETRIMVPEKKNWFKTSARDRYDRTLLYGRKTLFRNRLEQPSRIYATCSVILDVLYP